MRHEGRAMTLLEVNDLHVYYDQIHALKGVSLSVGAAEIVTLIGANGAGKSTTLKTISGLMRPRQGSATFGGAALNELAPHEIVARGVVHVPEGRRIFQRLTVLENLAMGGALMAAPRVLLLDEPSMGLAPVLVERIFDTIGQINGRGVAILLVEQNAAMALAIAHRGYVLETGSIALSGSAAELRENAEVRRAYLGEA